MARLSRGTGVRAGRLVLTANAGERPRAYAIPGAIPQPRYPYAITYPLDPQVVEDLQALYGDTLWLDPDIATWHATMTQTAVESMRLQRVADAYTAAPYDTELYPYQRVGAAWLTYVQRGILGDDPGLGKTIQALTAVRDCTQVLIVSFPSILGHWANHCADWLRKPDVAVARGTRAQRDALLQTEPNWLIVNHEMLRPALDYEMLHRRHWDAVIVDEAHRLQGRHSQMSQGAEALKTDRLYLLTGTPIWNKPDSLWHLLKLLDPIRWSSYWRFVDTYCASQITPWGRVVLGFRPAAIHQLRGAVLPALLRRTKEAVLPDLPRKRRQLVLYDLTPAQATAYRRLAHKRILTDGAGATLRRYTSLAAALPALRTLCSAPVLLGWDAKTGMSDKTLALDDLLASTLGDVADGRKVIVYTWYQAYARWLAERWQEQWNAICVTGNTPHRDETIAAYRTDPRGSVLVATIASTGIGIDLVEAHAAIFAEGSYVPTMNLQAEDRLHRIGQTTDVMVYRLAARGTVEEAIWQIADERAGMADMFLATDMVLQRTAALAQDATDTDTTGVHTNGT